MEIELNNFKTCSEAEVFQESEDDLNREQYISINNTESKWPLQKRRGLRPSVRIVERDLWKWYLSQNEKVPRNLLQLQARYKFQQAGISNFKASDGWYKRWIRRWKQYKKEDDEVDSGHNNATTDKNEIGEDDAQQSSNKILLSTEETSATNGIVTPSLGDTLDSTFPYLETSRLPEEQNEDCILGNDGKDDTKLSTPQHNSFEHYSLVSKVLKLKDCKEGTYFDLKQNCNRGLNGKSGEESKANDIQYSDSSEGNPDFLKTEGGGTSRSVQHIGRRYHSHFKERVLSYLKSHTIKETARKFGVHQSSISAWQKDKLRHKLIDEQKTDNTLVPAPDPVDVQFLLWLQQKRGNKISHGEVQECAYRLVSLAGGLPVVERQVRWFALWVRRLRESGCSVVGNDGGCMNLDDDRRVQYPSLFRIEVAAYAARFSQMAAVRTFHVSRKRVFDWLRTQQRITPPKHGTENSSSGKNVTGSGRSVTDPEVDKQVWQWYCDSQNERVGDGHLPTSQEVRAYAAFLYAKQGLSAQVSCSYGWFRRWCERFGVRLRYSLDDELLAWVLAQLDRNHALSHSVLQEQARQIWQVRRPDFKASPGWAIRFCKRYPKLLQAMPVITTPLPEPLRPLVDNFRASLKDLIRLHALTPSSFGNMDELPLGFSAPIVGIPKRQLLLRKPGMESCHATAVLSCLADGSLLPTMLILKDAVNLLQTEQNLIVLQQDKGIMDLNCMLKWLEFIWFRHTSSTSLLVADGFDPHCVPEVTTKFGDNMNKHRLLMHIPAGCSSKLQPLDVSVKRTFQKFIDQRWELLNSRGGSNWACGQQLRLPTSEELVQWVADAHNFIVSCQQETIRRSFLVTGLFVAENHSEDHYIENPAVLPAEEDLPEF